MLDTLRRVVIGRNAAGRSVDRDPRPARQHDPSRSGRRGRPDLDHLCRLGGKRAAPHRSCSRRGFAGAACRWRKTPLVRTRAGSSLSPWMRLDTPLAVSATERSDILRRNLQMEELECVNAVCAPSVKKEDPLQWVSQDSVSSANRRVCRWEAYGNRPCSISRALSAAQDYRLTTMTVRASSP